MAAYLEEGDGWLLHLHGYMPPPSGDDLLGAHENRVTGDAVERQGGMTP